jgi:hypothetical protein
MKIAYFSTLGHGRTRQPASSWPVPNELFDPDQALHGAAHSLPIAAGPRFVKLTLDFLDRGEFFVVNPVRE